MLLYVWGNVYNIKQFYSIEIRHTTGGPPARTYVELKYIDVQDKLITTEFTDTTDNCIALSEKMIKQLQAHEKVIVDQQFEATVLK